jgi:fructose-1,6-bisphosphatase/inositol monophosphatase family enzyme
MIRDIIDRGCAILRETARTVVLPSFAMGVKRDSWLKAPGELVTAVDNEAETAITARLRDLLPGSLVLGEEACSDPALLDRIGDPLVWLVDPIDGTANFAAGRPPFAMMMALLRSGEPVASWIHDPLSGDMSVAEKGAGAWMNGERLGGAVFKPSLGHRTAIVSQAFMPADAEGVPSAFEASFGSVVPTRRCAGAEYPLVASGAVDIALYWRTLAWDHGPGQLLVTEAGGRLCHLDGSAYDLRRPRSGLLVAGSCALAEELLTWPELKFS